MRRFLPCFILWFMMLALLSRYAMAATLQVAPVTLDLQSGQSASAVYLTNSGKAAIHAQIRVYEWTQQNGKDVLTATDEVVSSPAMTSLAPGQQQLVRIIVMQPGIREQEPHLSFQKEDMTSGHNMLSKKIITKRTPTMLIPKFSPCYWSRSMI